MIAKMPFVRQMEKQFEKGKKGQLISKKFAKSKVSFLLQNISKGE